MKLHAVAVLSLVWTLAATGSALAGETLELTLENHAFTPKDVTVKAGEDFSIHVVNKDPTPAEFESHPLKVEKVVAGQSEITVRVRALKPGAYEFYDEFNMSTATGTLTAE
jgi:plastocyanin